MDPELILAILGPLMASPAAMLSGWRLCPTPAVRSARQLEHLLWSRLWIPLLPPALICAVLIGWALAEQRPADERLTLATALVAFPFLVVWARALARAGCCLWSWEQEPLAGTVGFVRPVVLVSAALRRALDAKALAAVHMHEQAHASHRDPLRICLAQLATDLQWPCPAAPLRLRAWRRALEMARDEEARLAGADGLDLAAAILGAARLTAGPGRPSTAFLDHESSFRERIERLMMPAVADGGAAASVRTAVCVLVSLACAIAAGAAFADPIVAALLGALT